MGNRHATYEACFCACQEEWRHTDGATQEAFAQRLADLIAAPLAPGWPVKNRAIELCLIGRRHG